jgi:WD40 repeat protein
VFDVSGDHQTLVATLTGHDGPVWMCAWAHPKFGTLLASCSFDHKVIVWKEGEAGIFSMIYTSPPTLHEASVNALAWAPHEFGLSLAAASSDGSVSVITHKQDGACGAVPSLPCIPRLDTSPTSHTSPPSTHAVFNSKPFAASAAARAPSPSSFAAASRIILNGRTGPTRAETDRTELSSVHTHPLEPSDNVPFYFPLPTAAGSWETTKIAGAHSIGCTGVCWAPAPPPGSLVAGGLSAAPLVRRLVSCGCDNLAKIWRFDDGAGWKEEHCLRAHGTALQLSPIKPTSKAPGTQLLKLKYDILLSILLESCLQIQLAPLQHGDWVRDVCWSVNMVGRCRLTLSNPC